MNNNVQTTREEHETNKNHSSLGMRKNDDSYGLGAEKQVLQVVVPAKTKQNEADQDLGHILRYTEKLFSNSS